MQFNDPLKCLLREPAETYHAKSQKFLSSHQLADFRKSPLLYHRKKLGLIPNVDRPAFVLGRAATTLILEGRSRFEAEFAVGGPINPKTGVSFGSKTKAFQQWAASQQRDILTDGQYDLVQHMACSVKDHDLARELLSQGVPERVVRTDYCGVPCQIRMDWFEPTGGIVDLKTTDDLEWFECDARRYGYPFQLAFYRAVLAEAIDRTVPVHLVAVEKKEPYRAGLWQIDSDSLAIAERQNARAIERLKTCEATGEWPTGYEEKRVFASVA